MSNYDAREERGRFLLRALLCLIFICAVAGQVLYYEDFTRETGLYMAAAVLPTAVALWALHRGSWPGLVVFFIGSFNAIANVTGALAEGGRAAMGSPDMVVGFIDLLLRLTVVFCALRSTSVSQYLLCRRSFRRRRDDVLEIGLFVVALLLQLGIILWMADLFLHTGT